MTFLVMVVCFSVTHELHFPLNRSPIQPSIRPPQAESSIIFLRQLPPWSISGPLFLPRSPFISSSFLLGFRIRLSRSVLPSSFSFGFPSTLHICFFSLSCNSPFPFFLLTASPSFLSCPAPLRSLFIILSSRRVLYRLILSRNDLTSLFRSFYSLPCFLTSYFSYCPVTFAISFF